MAITPRPPLNRPPSVMAAQRRLGRRRDPNAMIASAAVMTGRNPSRAKMDVRAWQTKAWHYYDEIGELRFGVGWLANALSRVNLVAAVPPETQGGEPTPIDLEQTPGLRRAVELVEQIAGGVTGQGQLLAALTKMLTVPGLGYVFATADDLTDSFSSWRVLSNDEARRQSGETQVTDPESGDWYAIGPNDLLIKIWRPHPRRSWEPDSPVRSVLSSLQEIELLTHHIAANSRSRLVGAGLLLMPSEAEFPPGQGQKITPPDPDDPDAETDEADQFIETLVQVAALAYADPESPAAKVPLVARMPGEHLGKPQHLKFWTDFDNNIDTLRQAAVKRLALGLDMPPEVLLGLGDSNHWSAWQIAEEAITLHVEPLAETICHGLTIGFLRAALQAEGLEPDSVIVWYDTTDLTTRPDLTEAASEAHERILISDDAYLRELGLDPDDRPDDKEWAKRLLIKVAMAAPAQAAAMLAAAGYLPDDVAEAAAPPPPPPAPAEEPAPAEGQPGTPDTQPADGEAPPAAASILLASDILVGRALERAGLRLRAAAGKGRPGGATAIPCDDPQSLHCSIPATEYASLDHLLEGAWERLPGIAVRLNMNPESWARTLDGYCRGLISVGAAHDYDLLADALGVGRDTRLVPSH